MTNTERQINEQIDEQIDETAESWRLSKIVCRSFDSVKDLTVAKSSQKRGFCTGVTDGPTNGRPPFRDAFLTNASKTKKADMYAVRA